MRRFVLLAAFLNIAAPLVFAQTTTWVSDANHSEIDFVVTHLTVSRIHGRFGRVSATINYNEADVTKSTVTATIGVDTVDTGVAARDNDIKSSKFLDIAKLPTASFTSTSVARNGNHLTVTGNLTLHGVTKPVVLDVDGPHGSMTDQNGKVHTGFSATTTLYRTAFGIGPNYPVAIASDEVSLDIELEVVKQ